MDKVKEPRCMAQISIATSKDERSAQFCPVSLNWALKAQFQL